MTVSKVLLSDEYQATVIKYASDLAALSAKKKKAQELYMKTVKDIDTEAEFVENAFSQWHKSQTVHENVEVEKTTE